MAAYKDEARGTWYVSFHYNDWTGKNKRKLKRGFRTRKEALEYEQKFLLQQATNKVVGKNLVLFNKNDAEPIESTIREFNY